MSVSDVGDVNGYKATGVQVLHIHTGVPHHLRGSSCGPFIIIKVI